MQNDYSLINRRVEENGLSEASAPWNENVGFMAYNVLAGGVLGSARAGIHQDAELLALLGVPFGLDRTYERVGHERALEDVVCPRGHGAVEVVIRAVVAGDEDDERIALEISERLSPLRQRFQYLISKFPEHFRHRFFCDNLYQLHQRSSV